MNRTFVFISIFIRLRRNECHFDILSDPADS